VSRPPAWSPRSFLHRKVANLGSIAATHGRLDEALGSYAEAADIYLATGDFSDLAQTFVAMSRVLVAAGRKKEAVSLLEQAEQLTRDAVPVAHSRIVDQLASLRTESKT
jgi:tetratricopeptide (TPR) repeat protein